MALRLDDPVPRDDRRYVIAQWKRAIHPAAKGDYSPFRAMRLYSGHLGVTIDTDRVPSYPIGSAERPIRIGQCPAETTETSKAIGKSQLSTSSDSE